jgi:hypothetical protein
VEREARLDAFRWTGMSGARVFDVSSAVVDGHRLLPKQAQVSAAGKTL